MKIFVAGDEHIPVSVNMAPECQNIAFTIAPSPRWQRRQWIKAIGKAVVLPKEFDIRKQYLVNAPLKRLALRVRPQGPVPKRDIEIEDRSKNFQVTKPKQRQASAKFVEILDRDATPLIFRRGDCNGGDICRTGAMRVGKHTDSRRFGPTLVDRDDAVCVESEGPQHDLWKAEVLTIIEPEEAK
jgi:hypothetical protein